MKSKKKNKSNKKSKKKKREYYVPYKVFIGSITPNWILRRNVKEISQGAKLGFGRLCQFAGKNGQCFPSLSTLAKELGVSRGQTIKYIKELKKLELIEVIQVGKRCCNRYKFCKHKWITEKDLRDTSAKEKYLSSGKTTYKKTAKNQNKKTAKNQNKKTIEKKDISQCFGKDEEYGMHDCVECTKENECIERRCESQRLEFQNKMKKYRPMIEEIDKQTREAPPDRKMECVNLCPDYLKAFGEREKCPNCAGNRDCLIGTAQRACGRRFASKSSHCLKCILYDYCYENEIAFMHPCIGNFGKDKNCRYCTYKDECKKYMKKISKTDSVSEDDRNDGQHT